MYKHRFGRARPSRFRGVRLGVLLAALACVIPAAAWAGNKVTAGNQTLQISASATPNKAKAASIFKLHIDRESTVPNQHIQGINQEIQVQLPEDSHINPGNYAQCQYSAIATVPFSQIASHCPKGSVIGSGKFTADARPLVAKPVPGTLTLYSVKGQHNDVLMIGKTQFGYIGYLFIYEQNDNDGDHDGDPRLTATFRDTGGNSLYALKTVDLSLGLPKHKPFYTNPPLCPRGGWHAGLYLSTYRGVPPIEAITAMKCTKAAKKH